MSNTAEEDEFLDDIANEFELIKFTSDVQSAIEQVCRLMNYWNV